MWVSWMSDKRKLVTLLFLLVLSLLVGWTYFKLISNVGFIISMAIFSISGVMYIFLSPMMTFLFMVIEIFALGAFAIFFTWFRHASVTEQWHWIEVHGLFSFLSVLVWLVFFTIKQMGNQIQNLQQRIGILEKTIGGIGILTKNEFLYQTEIVLNSMSRRQESGYLLSVEIRTTATKTSSTLFHTLASAILSSVRGHYDLVGQAGSNTIWILMQNTSEQGLQIVSKRINQKILAELDESIYDVLKIDAKTIHPGDTLASLNLKE